MAIAIDPTIDSYAVGFNSRGSLVYCKCSRGTTMGKDPGRIRTDDPLAFFPDGDDMGLGVA